MLQEEAERILRLADKGLIPFLEVGTKKIITPEFIEAYSRLPYKEINFENGFPVNLNKAKYETYLNDIWLKRGLLGNSIVIPAQALLRYHLYHLIKTEIRSNIPYTTLSFEKDKTLAAFQKQYDFNNYITRHEDVLDYLKHPTLHPFSVLDLDIMSNMNQELYNILCSFLENKENLTKLFWFRITLAKRFSSQEAADLHNQLLTDFICFVRNKFKILSFEERVQRFRRVPCNYINFLGVKNG